MVITDDKHRRFKLFCVRDEVLLAVMNCSVAHDYISLMKPIGLPADAMIDGVDWSFSRRALLVRVWSSEYEPITPGVEMKVENGLLEFESVEFRRSDLPQIRRGSPDDIRRQIEVLQEMLEDRELAGGQ